MFKYAIQIAAAGLGAWLASKGTQNTILIMLIAIAFAGATWYIPLWLKWLWHGRPELEDNNIMDVDDAIVRQEKQRLRRLARGED